MSTIPSLRELSAHQVQNILPNVLDSVDFFNCEQVRILAETVLENFPIEVSKPLDGSNFVRAINSTLNSTKYKLRHLLLKKSWLEKNDIFIDNNLLSSSNNILASISDIFSILHDIFVLTSPISNDSKTLASLNRAIPIKLSYWAKQISLMDDSTLSNYLCDKNGRENLKTFHKLSICEDYTSSNLEEDAVFYLEQEFEAHHLQNIRDYSLPVFKDKKALKSLFSFDQNIYKRYRKALNQVPEAISTAIQLGQQNLDNISQFSRTYFSTILELIKSDSSYLLMFPWANIFKDHILWAIAQTPSLWTFASENLRSNRAFALQAVGVNPLVFECLNSNFRDDQEIAMLVIKKNGEMLQFASSRLKNQKSLVKAAIENFPNALRFANETLQMDKELFLYCAQKAGLTLGCLNFRQKNRSYAKFSDQQVDALEFHSFDNVLGKSNDSNAIKDLLKSNSFALLWASPQLQKSAKLIHLMHQNYQFPLELCQEQMGDNSEFVRCAVKERGLEIRFASQRVRKTLEVALAAVSRDSRALSFIDNSLRENDAFATLAIETKQLVLPMLNDKIWHHRALLQQATSANYLNLIAVVDQVQVDHPIVKECYRQCPNILRLFQKKIGKLKVFVIHAVAINGMDLRFASEQLQSDEEVVGAAVVQNPKALRHAGFQLRDNRDFLQRAILQSRGGVLEHASICMKNDLELALQAINHNVLNYFHISDLLKKEPKIICAILEKSPRFLVQQKAKLVKVNQIDIHRQMIIKGLSSYEIDWDLAYDDFTSSLIAVQKNPDSFSQVSSRLKKDRNFLLRVGFALHADIALQTARRFSNDLDIMIMIIQKYSNMGSLASTAVKNHPRFKEEIRKQSLFFRIYRLCSSIFLALKNQIKKFKSIFFLKNKII